MSKKWAAAVFNSCSKLFIPSTGSTHFQRVCTLDHLLCLRDSWLNIWLLFNPPFLIFSAPPLHHPFIPPLPWGILSLSFCWICLRKSNFSCCEMRWTQKHRNLDRKHEGETLMCDRIRAEQAVRKQRLNWYRSTAPHEGHSPIFPFSPSITTP